FMPSPVPAHSMAVPENTGDGLAMAEKAGGRLSAGSNEMGGLWSPVSVTRRKDGSAGLYPHILLDRAKPGLIAVNRAGRRFVNEGVSYHDFVEAMYRANETDPAIPAWLICDVTFVRKYGLGAIHPGTRNIRKFEKDGYLISASGIAALAGKLEIDPEGLTETVARHNRFARDGDDPDFGKGSTVLNRFNGDPENQPNPCLGPIATPPFIAMAVWPAEIACSSGLATDENARVLKDDGSPIGGLYACGNDMASIMEGHYPGPGTTLGPAMVFGYRAALHAAGQRAGNQ
ncbi:MAG: FAD-binding protein, partial [Rhodospirillaceae bacterium]|nr:FAD-binding protein [Rhodospirillaceae bacterium]